MHYIINANQTEFNASSHLSKRLEQTPHWAFSWSESQIKNTQWLFKKSTAQHKDKFVNLRNNDDPRLSSTKNRNRQQSNDVPNTRSAALKKRRNS